MYGFSSLRLLTKLFHVLVFAMVAGEWLCVYDIRIPNKHMLKELTHAGDATSVDWVSFFTSLHYTIMSLPAV